MFTAIVQEKSGKHITPIVSRPFDADNMHVVLKACNMIVYRHEQPYHTVTRVIQPNGNVVFTLTVK